MTDLEGLSEDVSRPHSGLHRRLPSPLHYNSNGIMDIMEEAREVQETLAVLRFESNITAPMPQCREGERRREH